MADSSGMHICMHEPMPCTHTTCAHANKHVSYIAYIAIDTSVKQCGCYHQSATGSGHGYNDIVDRGVIVSDVRTPGLKVQESASIYVDFMLYAVVGIWPAYTS